MYPTSSSCMRVLPIAMLANTCVAWFLSARSEILMDGSAPTASFIPAFCQNKTLWSELLSVPMSSVRINLNPKKESISPLTSAFHHTTAFAATLSGFVRWTFSSSLWEPPVKSLHLQNTICCDAGTSSAYHMLCLAWLGISILKPSPNLSGFRLIVTN